VPEPTTRVSAFTEFVNDVEPRLRHALVARFGPDRGRDAVADALAYAWEHWDRVGPMTNPAGYLYRVGQHSAISALRRRHRQLPQPVDDDPPWIEPALPDCLNKLSKHQRVAVLLIKGYGYTYREVADLFDVSISTVQQHVERGLVKLRNGLGVSVDA
jgi:RNA polymerase sigma-70 factor (ECF subfamily)